MAISSTQIDYTAATGEACEVLPVPPDHQLPSGHEQRGAGIQELARTYGELARQALEYAGISAVRAFHEGRHGIAENSSRAAYKTQKMITVAQDKARNAQRQYPMQVLGVLAGSAVAAGIAIRIWRSHESRS